MIFAMEGIGDALVKVRASLRMLIDAHQRNILQPVH
jgi:hypothetical protein